MRTNYRLAKPWKFTTNPTSFSPLLLLSPTEFFPCARVQARKKLQVVEILHRSPCFCILVLLNAAAHHFYGHVLQSTSFACACSGNAGERAAQAADDPLVSLVPTPSCTHHVSRLPVEGGHLAHQHSGGITRFGWGRMKPFLVGVLEVGVLQVRPAGCRCMRRRRRHDA